MKKNNCNQFETKREKERQRERDSERERETERDIPKLTTFEYFKCRQLLLLNNSNVGILHLNISIVINTGASLRMNNSIVVSLGARHQTGCS